MTFGPAWSLSFLPLLAFAAALSIPYSFYKKLGIEHDEEQFRKTLAMRNRTLLWADLQSELTKEKGLIVLEWLSFKGPVRWWWLSEGAAVLADLREIKEEGAVDTFYTPSDVEQWKARYTGLNGSAVMIDATEEQKESLMQDPFRFKEGVKAVVVALCLRQVGNDAIADEQAG